MISNSQHMTIEHRNIEILNSEKVPISKCIYIYIYIYHYVACSFLLRIVCIQLETVENNCWSLGERSSSDIRSRLSSHGSSSYFLFYDATNVFSWWLVWTAGRAVSSLALSCWKVQDLLQNLSCYALFLSCTCGCSSRWFFLEPLTSNSTWLSNFQELVKSYFHLLICCLYFWSE